MKRGDNIKRLKKKSSGMYTIECNGSTFDVHENTISRLNLLSSTVKCEDLIEEITYYNVYYELYSKCIKMYSKKLVSKFEFEQFLLKHTNDDEVIRSIINELESNNIINDELYKKAFIECYIFNSKYSSTRINKELEDKNIVLNYDEVERLKEYDYEKAWAIVNKHLKTATKSKHLTKDSCSVKLARYLYDRSIIFEVINNIDYDDTSALQKDFVKLQGKYEGKLLIDKLCKKGYNYEQVKKVIGEEYD